jgi:hypothetical protein
MENTEKKPSFEELSALESDKPSFEDMLAAGELPTEEIPQQPQEAGFPAAEIGLRSVRQAAKGATLGATEPVFGASTGAVDALYRMIQKGEFETAENMLKQYKEAYRQDIERQEQFAQEYPTTAMTAEIAGGMLPFSPAMKIAGAGLKGAASIGQLAKQAAIGGAATAAMSEATEQLTKAPYEAKTLAGSAEELAKATAAGAVAGPVLTAGMGAVAAAPYLGAKAVEKMGTSGPVRQAISVLLGPRADIQKKWYQVEKEIRDLSTPEEVAVFIESLKERIATQSAQNTIQLDDAISNMSRLSGRVEQAAETSKSGLKASLMDAKSELATIIQDLQNQKSVMGKEASVATRELKASMADPSMGPFVERATTALDEMKSIISDQSRAARELIDPDFRYEKSKIIQYAKEALSDLGVQGTGAALTDARVQAKGKIESLIKRVDESLPDVINGNQVKDILQQLDDEVDTLMPGKFGEKAENSIKAIRRNIDVDLKMQNKEYATAMKPVAEMSSFLSTASKELSTPTRIESAYRQAIKNPRVGQIFAKLKDYTGIDVAEPILTLKRAQELRGAGAFEAARMGLPAVEELRQLEEMLRITKEEDFNKVVSSSVKDPQLANKIIGLRSSIKLLSDPTFIKAKIQADIASGTASLQDLAFLESELSQRQIELANRMREFVKFQKGEQGVTKILRQPLNSTETVQATKLIEAIASLPDKEFKDLFEIINLKNPEDFKRVAELLRIDEAMSKPFIAGSRRTQVVKALGAAMGSVLGYEQSGNAYGAAFGALGGAQLDTIGPKQAKIYFRGLSKITGIPTVPKLEAISPVPFTPELKNLAKLEINSMLQGVDPTQYVYIDPTRSQAVMEDIQKSDLSSIERAKAISDLSKTNTISGKTLQKIMIQGEPVIKSTKAIGAKLVERKPAQELKQDKPDMLKAMTRGPQSVEDNREISFEADTGEMYSGMEPERLEKLYNEIIDQLMGENFTQEEAKQLAKRHLKFEPKSYKDGEGPSDEEIALEVEKEWDDEVLGLIQEGMTKEAAEALTEKVYGFNPNKKEEESTEQPELMRIISEKYRRLQEEGRL